MQAPLGYSFGRADARDRDALAEMFYDDMVDLGVEATLEGLRALSDSLLNDERGVHHVRVARCPEGHAVGVVVANEFLSLKFPGRALWIEELYVRPDHRRGGVGRMLVEDLLVWARAEGYQGVELEAYRMNTAASVLYRTLGFRRLARERYSFSMRDHDAFD
jgi:GNAT superfamily N-acetyltransferase